MSGPIPARVDETVKSVLLDIIDTAVAAGWSLNRVCAVIELDRQRAWRWMRRRDSGTLADRAPGGNPIHGLLDWEETEILAVFEQWGDIDMSHRKLAHRGSYEHRVWVSPSTVDRVLALTTIVTPEPTSVSVQVLFTNALQAEGLLSPEIAARLADPDNAVLDEDDVVPLLLAISDNGTEMKAADTRKFMALCS